MLRDYDLRVKTVPGDAFSQIRDNPGSPALAGGGIYYERKSAQDGVAGLFNACENSKRELDLVSYNASPENTIWALPSS